MELDDFISDESSHDLAPTCPISTLSSPLPIFLPSINPLESTFEESETFVLVVLV